ncbi:hypothetical protein M2322_002833 [Rhodoblastus acidophilus]|nr:hypothetical protein [Rhodoblastus acidophilus]
MKPPAAVRALAAKVITQFDTSNETSVAISPVSLSQKGLRESAPVGASR